MNPEDQTEETQDAADSPPAEETVEETPVEEAPVEPVPLAPVAPPVPTLAEVISNGAAAIQEGIVALRVSQTAEHDADMALVAAAAAKREATGSEDREKDNLRLWIDNQRSNLTALEESLNA